MTSFDLEQDPFNLGDGQGAVVLENILEYIDQLQTKLNSITTEVDTLRQQETDLIDGLQRVNQELLSARRFQMDLLTRPLPTCQDLKFLTLYMPAHQLSGDVYDVTRLNDEWVGINLSDCTGHGIAAAMLSVFINQTLRIRATTGQPARALKPDELLQRLNQELIEADFSDCQFVTSLHALYHEPTHCLTWARGGMPYPLLVRKEGSPQRLVSEGGLIGAFPEQEYELVNTVLEPGDTVVFYTDGLEALLLTPPAGEDCDNLLDTPWCQGLRSRSLEGSFAAVKQLLENTSDSDWPIDDVTILAVQRS